MSYLLHWAVALAPFALVGLALIVAEGFARRGH